MRPLILHVVATLDRGGTETSCLTIAKAFAIRGYHNRVAAIRSGRRSIADSLEAAAGPTTVLPAGRFARFRAFLALCRLVRPAAVIVHFFTIDHVVLALAARLAGVPKFIAVQGNPAPAQLALALKIRMILAASRCLRIPIVSASRWIETSLAALGTLPEGSRVIHNGCNVEAIATAANKTRAARTDGDAIVLMVARLDPIKDHETLLEAIATLSEVDGRRVRLDLAGDGVLQARLKTRAAALGVADRVRFLGPRSDVTKLLGASDVLCLSTTRDEGFGIVLIEALAAGIPIVASDVPACREVLEDGQLGRLVPAGNAKLLAQAISEATGTASRIPTQHEIARRYGADDLADSYAAVLGLSVCLPAQSTADI